MTLDLDKHPYLELIGMNRHQVLKRYAEIKAGRVKAADRARLAAAEEKRKRRAMRGVDVLVAAAVSMAVR